MISLHEKAKEFVSHRWLVFVCAIWLQSFAGISYIFGSISPVIKTSMGYNQKQLALIGVAKDLGDNIGFLAGRISEVSPIWRVLLVGAFQNSVGYGLVWLVVTHRCPSLPLWAVSSIHQSNFAQYLFLLGRFHCAWNTETINIFLVHTEFCVFDCWLISMKINQIQVCFWQRVLMFVAFCKLIDENSCLKSMNSSLFHSLMIALIFHRTIQWLLGYQ